MPRGGQEPPSIASVNWMVEVDNCLVLTVTNLGAIVDVVFAIPALLHDRVGVTFFLRWNDLYFDPETKDTIHFSQIDEQVPYWSHAVVVHGVIFNAENLAAVLLEFCKFVEQIFTTFQITYCFGRGNLLEISIHNGEG
jgi:hypothetical protein